MTIEPNNIKKLQQRNYNLVVENEFLKEQIDNSKTSRLIAENNRLNEICIYWEKEHDVLAEENTQLTTIKETLKQLIDDLNSEVSQIRQQNTQLKHKNKQQAKTIERLITIITDEHYN